MKQLKILSALVIVFVLLFSSCAADEETSTKTSVENDSTANAAPASTIVTTPETMMIVWHKVADFAKWKVSFEAHDSMKNANGLRNYLLGRSVEDSNFILVAVKSNDIAKAKAFAKDPSLKEAMKKGGVTGPPTFMFSNLVYQDLNPNMSDLRSMTMFTVKDWDAWKTSFESSRQLRKENGLTDRAYGHDVDDNKKVIIVVGIDDSTKAEAFWKSDILKQKRAEGGVVGEVKRYVYRVAHKY